MHFMLFCEVYVGADNFLLRGVCRRPFWIYEQRHDEIKGLGFSSLFLASAFLTFAFSANSLLKRSLHSVVCGALPKPLNQLLHPPHPLV